MLTFAFMNRIFILIRPGWIVRYFIHLIKNDYIYVINHSNEIG